MDRIKSSLICYVVDGAAAFASLVTTFVYKNVLFVIMSSSDTINSQQELIKRAARVEEAASKAVALVEEFSSLDPGDASPSNPWRNPDSMWTRLDQARAELQEAWRSIESEKPQLDKKVIRTAMYIDLITDSFSDCLEELSTNEEVDVDILADCLQSGLELLSSEEAELMMEQEEEEESPEKDYEEQLTPHEQRRRDLGFDVDAAK